MMRLHYAFDFYARVAGRRVHVSEYDVARDAFAVKAAWERRIRWVPGSYIESNGSRSANALAELAAARAEYLLRKMAL